MDNAFIMGCWFVLAAIIAVFVICALLDRRQFNGGAEDINSIRIRINALQNNPAEDNKELANESDSH